MQCSIAEEAFAAMPNRIPAQNDIQQQSTGCLPGYE
jgi:hypothetical protein